MDEVIHDLASLEHMCDGVSLSRVRCLPDDARRRSLLSTRDRHDLVRARQLGQQRSTDRPGGAEDDDFHRRASRINRAK